MSQFADITSKLDTVFTCLDLALPAAGMPNVTSLGCHKSPQSITFSSSFPFSTFLQSVL